MKNFGYKKVLAVTLAALMVCSITSCGKKKAVETTESTTESTAPSIETTAATTTTLMQYTGPLPSSDVEVTWTETTIDQTVRYALVSEGEFLRVRKGPGTEYNIVGTLTRNQQVVVVAVTSNNWYKTTDGFYVSGDFLTSTPS